MIFRDVRQLVKAHKADDVLTVLHDLTKKDGLTYDESFSFLFACSISRSNPSACWPRICKVLLSKDIQQQKNIVDLLQKYLDIFDCIHGNRVLEVAVILRPRWENVISIPNTMNGFDTSLLSAISIIPSKWTLLHHAAHSSSKEMVIELIQCGISVGIVDSDQRTSLHIASKALNINVIECLVDQHGLINTIDKYGKTGLCLLLETMILSKWIQKFAPKRMLSTIMKLVGDPRSLWSFYSHDAVIFNSAKSKVNIIKDNEKSSSTNNGILSSELYMILKSVHTQHNKDDFIAIHILEIAKYSPNSLWDMNVIKQLIILSVRQKRVHLMESLFKLFSVPLFEYFRLSDIELDWIGDYHKYLFLQRCLILAVQNNSSVSVVLLLIGHGAIHSGSDSISCSNDSSNSNNRNIDEIKNNISDINSQHLPRRAETSTSEKEGEKIASFITPTSNLCIQLSILRCAERSHQDMSVNNQSQYVKSDLSLSLAIKENIVRLRKQQTEDNENDQNNCCLVLDSILENCSRSALISPIGLKEDYLKGNGGDDTDISPGNEYIRVSDINPSLLGADATSFEGLQALSPLCLASFIGCHTTLGTILNSLSFSGNLNAEACLAGLNPITCCAIAGNVECLIAIKDHMGVEEFCIACSNIDGTGLTPLTGLLHIIKAQASHCKNIENRLIPSNTFPNSLLHIKLNSSYVIKILEILLQSQKISNPIPHGPTAVTPESVHSIGSGRYEKLKNRLQKIESRLHNLITLYQPPNPSEPYPLNEKPSISNQIYPIYTSQKDSSRPLMKNNIPYHQNKIPSKITYDLSPMIVQMERSEQFQKVNTIITKSQDRWMVIKKSLFTLPSLRYHVDGNMFIQLYP